MKFPSESKRRVLKIASDSIWSIAGLVLMNVVAQFVIYPIWNRQLGNESYGHILYLISAMNILAISMGISCNYARMRSSADGETYNRNYNRILSVTSLISVPFMLIANAFSGATDSSVLETVLMILLTIATMWRFYADVEYRLSLNYKGYFVYYLVISCGYGIGVGLFLLTNLWPLALLPGEIAGLLLVYWKGSIFQKDPDGEISENTKTVLKIVLTLFSTSLISNLVSNGDRFLLNFIQSGTAVTIYYQASLLGKTMTLVTTPLNSVIIGYLARTDQKLDKRMMNILTLSSMGATVLVTVACTVASHIVIHLLYPQNYDLVKGYFLIANLGQVAGFVSSIVTTFLLRYCKVQYQLYVNIVYIILFAAICFPGAMLWGMEGFCIAATAVHFLRLCYSLFLGYWSLRRKEGGQNETAGSAGSAV